MTAAQPRLAPGPPGEPVLGHVRAFAKDALAFLMLLNREHGGIARFRLGPRTAHLVSDPALVKYVLQENHQNYRKGRAYARARFAFGDGLITSDGESWHRHRKLMQPVFHKRHYELFASIMQSEVAAMGERWQRAAKLGPVDIATELRSLALRIAARSLFSTDIDTHAADLQERFNRVQRWFTRGSRSGYLVPPWFPSPANLRLQQTLRALDRMISGIIAARRAARSRPSDLLSLLLDARDEEDGSRLGDEELRDEVMTLLFAAHESTGTTIAWAMYLLSKHPEIERRVRDEVKRTLDGRPPSFADLEQLAFTKQVAEETMRLYPAGPIMPREVVRDDEIGGYFIPARSVVFVSPYVTHRDPRHWDNPEAFDPDRFAPDRAAARHRFSYIPFLRGPRQCIGNDFALTEILVALPMIVERFRFELVPGVPIAAAHMRFDEGMLMKLREVS